MKTQISKQHTTVIAVQPLTPSRKGDRVKTHSFTWLTLALLTAMVVTMAMPAMAQSGWCNVNYCEGQIGRLYVNTNSTPPTVYVSVPGVIGLPLDCTLQSGVYFTLPSNSPGYAQIYSLLLQAKTTNTPVIIRAVDYSSGCTIGYAVAGPPW